MNNHVSIDDQLKQIITPNGKSYYHVQLQKAWIMAFILAMATLASLVFLVSHLFRKPPQILPVNRPLLMKSLPEKVKSVLSNFNKSCNAANNSQRINSYTGGYSSQPEYIST